MSLLVFHSSQHSVEWSSELVHLYSSTTVAGAEGPVIEKFTLSNPVVKCWYQMTGVQCSVFSLLPWRLLVVGDSSDTRSRAPLLKWLPTSVYKYTYRIHALETTSVASPQGQSTRTPKGEKTRTGTRRWWGGGTGNGCRTDSKEAKDWPVLSWHLLVTFRFSCTCILCQIYPLDGNVDG